MDLQELKGIDEWLCQDLNKRLSKWFASRLDARWVIRKQHEQQQLLKAHSLRSLRE
jgi:hypothetical protein